MAKKRKVSSQNVDGRRDGRNRDQSSKLTINTYEDAADSEDEFFINRDKILLDEGPEQKRRRKLEEDGQCNIGFRSWHFHVYSYTPM